MLHKYYSQKYNYVRKKKLLKIKIKRSCGYDEITARILNIRSPFIVLLLTYICNGMLTTGTFLDRLK
jgi:hypothetical protein